MVYKVKAKVEAGETLERKAGSGGHNNVDISEPLEAEISRPRSQRA